MLNIFRNISVMSAVVLAFGFYYSPAQAAPVYLSCIFPGSEGDGIIDFTADEAAGTVSIFIKSSGRSRTVNGAFTPDQVRVEERDVRWVINRQDLSVTRIIHFIDSTTRGNCQIQVAPQRAF